MDRLKSLGRRAWVILHAPDRDLLALIAIACIAIGLSTVAIALSWLAVGVFLMVAASGPRRSA